MKQTEMNQFAVLFTEIEKRLQEQEIVRVAIDGRCSAGKTTLAAELAERFDCNVFRVDDFFLPLDLRTEERLGEVGGNFHYERWEEEVGRRLKSRQPFSYGVFDCSIMAISHQQHVAPKPLNIIEGSYSLHPRLRDAYDIKVFLTVDPKIQQERILERNGAEKWKRFESEWIPKEEAYFRQFAVAACADFTFSTDNA